MVGRARPFGDAVKLRPDLVDLQDKINRLALVEFNQRLARLEADVDGIRGLLVNDIIMRLESIDRKLNAFAAASGIDLNKEP